MPLIDMKMLHLLRDNKFIVAHNNLDNLLLAAVF